MSLKKFLSGLSVLALVAGTSTLLSAQCEATYYEDDGDIIVPCEFPTSWDVKNFDIDYKPY